MVTVAACNVAHVPTKKRNRMLNNFRVSGIRFPGQNLKFKLTILVLGKG